MKFNNKNLSLFFYNYEYDILNVTGLFCGLIILFIANNFFINNKMYYLIFSFGLLVGSFGFIIEYYIRTEKKKNLEKEFGFFLYDLSKEYKKTTNLSLSLLNLSEYNFYGNINSDIKRIANRVSWGDSFENALSSVNKNINSQVINHTLVLLEVFNKSKISFDVILKNISNDINVFKSENRHEKYFSNLFYLSLVFYIILIFVLLYINYIIGSNFLWIANTEIITRLFFDNFILYIALLLGIFTAYVMFSIKKDNSINFIKYVLLIFVITIISFQILSPKPDAEKIIIDTINYMEKNDLTEIEMEKVIALKAISSKHLSESTNIEHIYFYSYDNIDCDHGDCMEYVVLIDEPAFLNFVIKKINYNYYNIFYEKYI